MAVINRSDELAIIPGTEGRSSDPSPIRISRDERRRRAVSARSVIADTGAIQSGPDEDDTDLFRALDEAYPGRFNLKELYADEPDPA